MISCKPQSKQGRRSERGSILAISAIGMLALLLATGMAVDISHLYSAKAELQNTADAAAIAAAAQLNSTTSGIQLAAAAANTEMSKVGIIPAAPAAAATPGDGPIGGPVPTVTFAANLNGSYLDSASAQASPQTIRFVKVNIPNKQVNLTFAALVIPRTQTLSASATAGMSVGLTMNKFHTALTFIEPNDTPLKKEQVHTLDAKAWNKTTPTSYRVLSPPDGDDVLDGTIHAYGYHDGIYTLAELDQDGECRRTRLGINTRFGDYTLHPGSNERTAPPDQVIKENITYDDYRTMQQSDTRNHHKDGVKDRRIMVLPIARQDKYDVNNRRVTANRLGAFFIRRKVNADCKLEVEYIGKPFVVPVGGFTPGGIQSSELSITVLYK